MFVATLLVLATNGTSAASSSRSVFRLLAPAAAKSTSERSSVASVREAPISFDLNALAAGRSTGIIFPLLDDNVYSAKQLQFEGLETHSADCYTWRGKLEWGKYSGDVIFTVNRGFVAGLIYSPVGVYEIAPKGEGQVLIELDQSLFPTCGGAIRGDDAEVASAAVPAAGVDSGDRIDVLILYTAAVRTSLGGETQAQAFAQQTIDSANTAYINSKIRQRLRLAGASLTAITETGVLGTELSAVRTDATTAALRDSVKADLVGMLSNSTDNCGIGYLMGSIPGNANNGFTVTSRTCAVGNLSFAHELGHNMGSQHNPENGSGPTFPYSYGHYVNGSYRTVMSYVDPCTSGCSRVAYFSNPAVIFNSQPTGIDNARDNARSINNTADSIANYRYSGSSITLGNFNGSEMVPRNIRRSLIWTSDNVAGDVKIEISRDGGTTWTVLLSPTPNDNQENCSFGPRVTKRARIRITSLLNPTVSDTSTANISIR